MNSFYNDLINNNTLAPLQEEQLKEYYNPTSLGEHDIKILQSISHSSIRAIETTIGALTHLASNLKIYKDCMIASINLQAESADIATKYTKEIPQQSNILPGIVSAPQSFDLSAIRTDNERMMKIKKDKDKIQQQKDTYLRVAKEDVRLFLSAWKKLNISNAAFDEFIDSLNKQITDGGY